MDRTSCGRFWVSELDLRNGLQLHDEARIWTPLELVSQRGLALPDDRPHDVFIDYTLGYMIERYDDEASPSYSRNSLPTQRNFDISIKFPSDDFAVDFAEPTRKNDGAAPRGIGEVPSPSPANDSTTSSGAIPQPIWIYGEEVDLPWYAERLGGWPLNLDGNDQSVAILDLGIAPQVRELPRDPLYRDFCSCSEIGATPVDPTGHGTSCAAVIGARWTYGRDSSAPGSTILAAKVTRDDDGPFTTLVDLLLMLSWAVHSGARIISMSFCSTASAMATKGAPEILGAIAQRLRKKNLALIFCAADEQTEGLTYPANLDGVIAVSGYSDVENPHTAVSGPPVYLPDLNEPDRWKSKNRARELLFAPGWGLRSLRGNGRGYFFGSSSGACAFAAGVAALYLQKYGETLTLDAILARMRDDCDLLPNPSDPQNRWHCLRFPN